jgi:hypothetical protein
MIGKRAPQSLLQASGLLHGCGSMGVMLTEPRRIINRIDMSFPCVHIDLEGFGHDRERDRCHSTPQWQIEGTPGTAGSYSGPIPGVS